MFGALVHGPGKLRYFGFNITQFDNITCVTGAYDKLEKLELAVLTQFQKKAMAEPLNKL